MDLIEYLIKLSEHFRKYLELDLNAEIEKYKESNNAVLSILVKIQNNFNNYKYGYSILNNNIINQVSDYTYKILESFNHPIFKDFHTLHKKNINEVLEFTQSGSEELFIDYKHLFIKYKTDDLFELIKILNNWKELGDIVILFQNYYLRFIQNKIQRLINERKNNTVIQQNKAHNMSTHNNYKGIQIFISHSTKDKVLVDNLIDVVLVTLFGINRTNIFCTSSTGIGIPTGENWLPFLKNKLKESDVFIPIITDGFIKSSSCLFEYGYVFIAGMKNFPLINNVDINNLPEWMQTVQSEKLDLKGLWNLYLHLKNTNMSIKTLTETEFNPTASIFVNNIGNLKESINIINEDDKFLTLVNKNKDKDKITKLKYETNYSNDTFQEELRKWLLSRKWDSIDYIIIAYIASLFPDKKFDSKIIAEKTNEYLYELKKYNEKEPKGKTQVIIPFVQQVPFKLIITSGGNGLYIWNRDFDAEKCEKVIYKFIIDRFGHNYQNKFKTKEEIMKIVEENKFMID